MVASYRRQLRAALTRLRHEVFLNTEMIAVLWNITPRYSITLEVTTVYVYQYFDVELKGHYML